VIKSEANDDTENDSIIKWEEDMIEMNTDPNELNKD